MPDGHLASARATFMRWTLRQTRRKLTHTQVGFERRCAVCRMLNLQYAYALVLYSDLAHKGPLRGFVW